MITSETQQIFNQRCRKHDHRGDRSRDEEYLHVRPRRARTKLPPPAKGRANTVTVTEFHNEPTISGAIRAALQLYPEISIDPEVMDGQPCISGTFIPVRAIIRALEEFGSVDRVVDRYPPLTPEQVAKALRLVGSIIPHSPAETDLDADQMFRCSRYAQDINVAISGLRSVVGAITEGLPLQVDQSLRNLFAEVAAKPRGDAQDVDRWAHRLAESVGNLTD